LSPPAGKEKREYHGPQVQHKKVREEEEDTWRKRQRRKEHEGWVGE
jgi:hypothetical protein